MQNRIEQLEAWIERNGEITGTCTKDILGKICSYCQCGKRDAMTQNETIATELDEMADWFSKNSYANPELILRKRAKGYRGIKAQ